MATKKKKKKAKKKSSRKPPGRRTLKGSCVAAPDALKPSQPGVFSETYNTIRAMVGDGQDDLVNLAAQVVYVARTGDKSSGVSSALLAYRKNFPYARVVGILRDCAALVHRQRQRVGAERASSVHEQWLLVLKLQLESVDSGFRKVPDEYLVDMLERVIEERTQAVECVAQMLVDHGLFRWRTSAKTGPGARYAKARTSVANAWSNISK